MDATTTIDAAADDIELAPGDCFVEVDGTAHVRIEDDGTVTLITHGEAFPSEQHYTDDGPHSELTRGLAAGIYRRAEESEVYQ